MLAALLAFFGVFYYAVQTEKGNKGPDNMRLPTGIEFGKASVDGSGAKRCLTSIWAHGK